jgi:HAE1 family hydrophobic/amphiphilic exporter-1
LFGSGDGGEFRKGLATVLIGGLITSMFLTLLVVPTAYSLLESATRRTQNLFRRRKPAPATAGAAPGGVTIALGPEAHSELAPANGSNGSPRSAEAVSGKVEDRAQ